MPLQMFVRNGCPHSAKAEQIVETFPEKLRSQVQISQINFRNRPPNVTRVPTLITQEGDTLVGADVFTYLKRWRYDAVPPGTAEAFAAISSNKMGFFLLVVAVLAVLYYFYKKGTFTRGTGRLPAFAGADTTFAANAMPVSAAQNLFW